MNTVSYAALSVKYSPRWSDIQKVAAWCANMVQFYNEAEARKREEKFPRTERVPKPVECAQGRVHEADVPARWDYNMKSYVPDV